MPGRFRCLRLSHGVKRLAVAMKQCDSIQHVLIPDDVIPSLVRPVHFRRVRDRLFFRIKRFAVPGVRGHIKLFGTRFSLVFPDSGDAVSICAAQLVEETQPRNAGPCKHLGRSLIGAQPMRQILVYLPARHVRADDSLDLLPVFPLQLLDGASQGQIEFPLLAHHLVPVEQLRCHLVWNFNSIQSAFAQVLLRHVVSCDVFVIGKIGSPPVRLRPLARAHLVKPEPPVRETRLRIKEMRRAVPGDAMPGLLHGITQLPDERLPLRLV